MSAPTEACIQNMKESRETGRRKERRVSSCLRGGAFSGEVDDGVGVGKLLKI